jgi:hypothetical protein
MQGLDHGDEQNNPDFRQRPIHRPLHCHPEPFAAAQGKLREGSVVMAARCFAALSMTVLSGLSVFFYFIMNV